MAKRRLKACNQPGCPELQYEPRCPEHTRDNNRHRRATTPTKIHEPTDRARRARAVAAHRKLHGNWCPGWEHHPPHHASDLTADHVIAIANGGHPQGELIVRCRSCNSAKSNR